MKYIPLTRGKQAIVDDEWYPILYLCNWYARNCDNKYYASRNVRINGKKKTIYLHRFMMSSPDGMEVDHINGDSLDNRRSNLRIVTSRQNKLNKSVQSNNTSGYKGVSLRSEVYRKKRWEAQIKVGDKIIKIGSYITPKEAALAYNEAARKYFGEYAKLNEI